MPAQPTDIFGQPLRQTKPCGPERRVYHKSTSKPPVYQYHADVAKTGAFKKKPLQSTWYTATEHGPLQVWKEGGTASVQRLRENALIDEVSENVVSAVSPERRRYIDRRAKPPVQGSDTFRLPVHGTSVGARPEAASLAVPSPQSRQQQGASAATEGHLRQQRLLKNPQFQSSIARSGRAGAEGLGPVGAGSYAGARQESLPRDGRSVSFSPAPGLRDEDDEDPFASPAGRAAAASALHQARQHRGAVVPDSTAAKVMRMDDTFVDLHRTYWAEQRERIEARQQRAQTSLASHTVDPDTKLRTLQQAKAAVATGRPSSVNEGPKSLRRTQLPPDAVAAAKRAYAEEYNRLAVRAPTPERDLLDDDCSPLPPGRRPPLNPERMPAKAAVTGAHAEPWAKVPLSKSYEYQRQQHVRQERDKAGLAALAEQARSTGLTPDQQKLLDRGLLRESKCR